MPSPDIMRLILRGSVALLGLLAGCRSPPDVTPSTSISSARASPASVPSDLPAATPAPAAWISVGKGVSWVRRERKDSAGRNTVWGVLRVTLSDATITIVQPPHGRLEQLSNQPGIIAAVNGPFFEADEAPSGLLISRGRRVAAFNPRGGSGILVVGEGRARLVPAEVDAATAEGDLVLQCGPRLIEPDGSLGIRSDDGKRASRTVACIRDRGAELDLVLAWTRNSDRDGPGLLEMAKWLLEPLVPGDTTGCEAALNLDGGPSSGIVLRDRPDELHKPFGRVPFAVAVKDVGRSL